MQHTGLTIKLIPTCACTLGSLVHSMCILSKKPCNIALCSVVNMHNKNLNSNSNSKNSNNVVSVFPHGIKDCIKYRYFSRYCIEVRSLPQLQLELY